ncbi:tetratricopeptide repeat protein [Microbulbifer hydrolyticus]|uniref:Tetratricopeptide (TPR) repeat protein n=1 Tax=Microbulbifer hydrolyticus TaxID=48074 RepID=A0A6P1T7R1_9GAMM|nr:tetratricopeptide repeat protein [Microbulbifer hydrolyticus]MBB5211153.1 tetratricopeptide (TPR) repeat protein [Microbulbifer hydrolyticus]QHQ38067.1 tetratricopeptide repeat protein [Microbulbifer hydrolyticus]
MNMTTVTKGLSKLVLRTSVALPLVLAPAVSVTVLEAVGVSASFAQSQAAEQKTRKTPSMRESAFKYLGKAQEAADAGKWQEALAALREMEAGKSKLNGYETAQMYYFYGFVYYSMEKYPQAINYYKQVLQQGEENLPVALEVGTLLTIAQLYFVTEDYKQALVYLNRWFALADNVTADSYALRAQAYHQVGNAKNAMADITKAISMYEQDGKTPKENWFQLQRYFYYEQNDYKNVAKVLEKLVKYYPKGEYYRQLAGMYGELKREDDMLHMMEAAYVAGALQKEKELLNMAYLFMGAEMPYKGAKVIDKGIKEKKIKRTSKNLETLAQAYQMAQELQKSIPELEAAASMSDKGDLYSRLASIYLDLDDNKKAIDMGAKALKKGGIKRPDQLYIVLGMANANLKKYDTSLKYLEKAVDDKRSEKFAKQWITFVKAEQEREKQLAM